MADQVNYYVNAYLRVRGQFAKQIQQQARSLRGLSKSLEGVSARLNTMGRATMGQTGVIAANFARIGAGAALAAGGAGLGLMVQNGIEFNRTMENATLSVGTMYQAFNLGANAAEVLSGETDQFAYNVQQAEAMMDSIYGIAKKSPASFRQIAESYQYMAAGLSGVTGDLERQRNILEKSAVLGGLVDGDYRQLGADIGRLASGQAGLDVRTFAALQKPIREALSDVTGKEVTKNLAQAFNEAAPEARLKTLEQVLGRIPPSVGEAFATSFDGIVSTTKSNLETLSSAITSPMFDAIKRTLVRFNSEGGIFGTDSVKRLESIAAYIGDGIGKGVEWGAKKLEKAVTYIRDNFEKIVDQLKVSGAAMAVAIKSALVIGTTKFVAGAAMVGVSKGTAAAGKAANLAQSIGGFLGQQRKMASRQIGKSALTGQGSGILGQMGKLIGRMSGASTTGFFTSFGTMLTSIATGASTVLAFGGGLIIAIGLLGALGVAVAGGAAYFIENFGMIRDSLVQAFTDGTITLLPLVKAAYQFYYRLVMIGEAIFGTMNTAEVAQQIINGLASTIMLGVKVVGFFVKVISLLVGAVGVVKLAITALIQRFGLFASVLAGMGVISQSQADHVKAMADAAYRDTQDTFFESERFARLADKLMKDVQFTPTQLAEIDKKSSELAKGIAGAIDKLGEAGKKGKPPKTPRGPQVNIDKVNMEVDLRGEDPDRLLSALITPLEKMAEKRTQAYEQIDQGY